MSLNNYLFLCIFTSALAQSCFTMEKRSITDKLGKLSMNTTKGKSQLPPKALNLLIKSCKEGNLQAVQMVINDYSNAHLNSKNDEENTPLHFACMKGHTKIAALLLARNADPNIQSKSGWTPLHWACMNGHSEITTLLLANGANPTIQNNFGNTALHGACSWDYKEVVIAIIDFFTFTKTLESDNNNDHKEMLRVLCTLDPTLKDRALRFLMCHYRQAVITHNALRLPKPLLLRILLHASDATNRLIKLVNIKNEKGETPFDVAKDEVKKLLKPYIVETITHEENPLYHYEEQQNSCMLF